MRERFAALILAAALVALCGLALACGGGGSKPASSGGGYPSEVQLTDADAGRAIKLANGGQLIISLTSNPSTGFGWSVQPPATDKLELQGGAPHYVPPSSTTNLVGAPGTEVFTFVAKATGTAQLTLMYRRPFDVGVAPAKTFTVMVDIK
jgi:inhibitor of cysteine peptidase